MSNDTINFFKCLLDVILHVMICGITVLWPKKKAVKEVSCHNMSRSLSLMEAWVNDMPNNPIHLEAGLSDEWRGLVQHVVSKTSVNTKAAVERQISRVDEKLKMAKRKVAQKDRTRKKLIERKRQKIILAVAAARAKLKKESS